MPRRDVALAALVIAIWGVNFVAANIAMESLPPLLMAALRFTLVALPAVFFVRPPGNGVRAVVLSGLFMGTLQFGLLYSAMMLGMPAGLASLVLQVQPILTVMIAAALLGERPNRTQVIGIVIGLVGMTIVGWQFLAHAPLLPFAMTIAAAAGWAAGNVVTRHSPPRTGFSLVVWSALVPPVPLLILSLFLEGWSRDADALAHVTLRSVGGLAFVAYGASMIGYGLWNLLLSRHAAATVAPWSMFVPVIGAIAAFAYNGERPTPVGLLGGAVTVVGVLIALGVGRRWLARGGRAAVDRPDAVPAAEPPGL